MILIVVLSIWSQEFDDYRDADDAVYELNGKELLGERYKTLSIPNLFDFRKCTNDIYMIKK